MNIRNILIVLVSLIALKAHADANAILDCTGSDIRITIFDSNDGENSAFFATVSLYSGDEWQDMLTTRVTAKITSHSTEYEAPNSGVGEFYLSVVPARSSSATAIFKGSIPKSGLGHIERTLTCFFRR